jgi:hypothetical protein
MERAASVLVLGVLVFATPVRALLLAPGMPWWTTHAAWAALIALGAWALRGARDA